MKWLGERTPFIIFWLYFGAIFLKQIYSCTLWYSIVIRRIFSIFWATTQKNVVTFLFNVYTGYQDPRVGPRSGKKPCPARRIRSRVVRVQFDAGSGDLPGVTCLSDHKVSASIWRFSPPILTQIEFWKRIWGSLIGAHPHKNFQKCLLFPYWEVRSP